jgi:hypothetical protein
MLAAWVEVNDADLRQPVILKTGRRASFRVTGDSHRPDDISRPPSTELVIRHLRKHELSCRDSEQRQQPHTTGRS